GTGGAGAWTDNGDGTHTWTSDPIVSGTNYNISISDAGNCAPIELTGASPVCCVFEVTCPTFEPETLQCYSDLPTQEIFTVAEFEALGNGDGSIGDIPCGVIEITASNSADDGTCSQTVTRTYTITEYEDTNGNGVRDAGEDTELSIHTCDQIFTIEDTTAPEIVGSLDDQEVEGCEVADMPTAATTIAELEELGLTITDNCTATADLTLSSTDVASGTISETVTRTYTIADACGNETELSQVFTLIVIDSPDAGENGTLTICEGEAVTEELLFASLGGTPDADGTWNDNGDGTWTYTVAANAPCTEEAVSVVTVEVVDSPDAGENGTLTICEGEEITTAMLFDSLGGTPDADGTWTDNGDGMWTYTVAATAPCTEDAVSVVTIIVVDSPDAGENGTLTICEGEEVTTTMLFASLGGTPDADGTWTDNGDGTWTYTVAATAPCTEEAVSVVTVVVIDSPDAGENGTLTICEGEEITTAMLFASLGGTPDADGEWTDNGDGTWTYTVAANAPCTEEAVSVVTVVVVDNPDAGENGTLTICEGEAVTDELLFASLGGTPDADGTWNDNGDGTWTYTVAANAPCTEEAVSVVTVVVVDNPDAGENGTLTICEGESVTDELLFASLGGTPDADGTWNDNGDGTWTYTVAANAPCTEDAVSVVTVIVVDSPDAGENGTLTICEGEEVTTTMLFASLGGTP
ncbi:hypothetical protein, partial [Mongoliibacter ruber]|uniref:hypothetical protein n=1 Tax=Mongoliibacter ruber TaxID=1750599 RepID=UPI0014743E92